MSATGLAFSAMICAIAWPEFLLSPGISMLRSALMFFNIWPQLAHSGGQL